MMETSKNPFGNLYLTESIPADEFVKIFSPVLVRESETHLLFQPGSVILRGLQGTGKSALLNLLKPETLMAFLDSDEPWPLPQHCSKFLSANISLRSSGALEFGQRSFGVRDDDVETVTGLLFGDFLNYWIVDDLLGNLMLLNSEAGKKLANFLGVKCSEATLEKFAVSISKNKCWFGALEKVSSFSTLQEAIKERIFQYESFFNYNSDLPPKFLTTKTRPGDPIGAAAEALKNCEIIPHDLPIFISIDQFEDLMDLEKDAEGNFSTIFRSVVMKMLGNRDKRVSYRVGARPYSLTKGFQGFGNNAFTEEMREFKTLDLGELVSNKESRSPLFPKFCDDVLRRRLENEEFPATKFKTTSLRHIFGPNATPEAKVKRFIKGVSPNFISPQKNWPKGAEEFLRELAVTDPISAKQGEAWLRQKNKQSGMTLKETQSLPWTYKPWWKKERKQLALLQVFSQSQQRMVWYGPSDIVSLSGNNIIVFLSLCQFIWSEYLRTKNSAVKEIPKEIDAQIQSTGIMSASEYWLGKVKAEPKGGDDRHRFVHVLAANLRQRLKADRQMSYPGENGFSLPLNKLKDSEIIDVFLDNCVAFGALEKARHTSKKGGLGLSVKWYLSSILTPYFQLPTPHVKEPYYATLNDIYDWMEEAKVIEHSERPIPTKKRGLSETSDDQLHLNLYKRD